MRRKHLVPCVMSVWLMIVSALMILIRRVDIEILFILWMIGILMTAELIGTGFSRPRYYTRLSWFIALGILFFGAIIMRRIWVILT